MFFFILYRSEAKYIFFIKLILYFEQLNTLTLPPTQVSCRAVLRAPRPPFPPPEELPLLPPRQGTSPTAESPQSKSTQSGFSVYFPFSEFLKAFLFGSRFIERSIDKKDFYFFSGCIRWSE